MSTDLSPSGNAILKRAEELDALDAILPFDRRDQLAELLTDDDVATLKHLASEGMGDNTMRALASDLAYLEVWCSVATGTPLPWPAPESLLLKFVAHHLWDPAERETNPDHGMPEDVSNALRVKGLLRSTGPHAPATVRRRLTSWSILTRWRGLTGPFSAPSLKSALRLAVRASNRPRQRKSKKAVTGDILAKLLTACAGDRLVDLRDRALLLMAFASGGRRRSEVAGFRVEDLMDEEPVHANPADEHSPLLPCLTIRLGRTKTTSADDNEHVVLIGRPVTALKHWLEAAKIEAGPVFRRIDQWGNVDCRAMTPQSVNLILKTRIAQAGLDPAQFSAHGLRSGYLTEAANRGIPLPEAMQQSLHKSVTQASGYYNNTERKMGRAARLVV
ncbi:site-specific integrase [Rhizobium tubonense]|uniref:Integrase n=1 Tax=Rhizobium tubonense TaxID=484088 RepID=A0A2W4CPK8_9HYPH|nr:site-specific integrase [Rhizobium tubonense]PZM12898.1 integrase [Rhizobium tubonense]